MTAVLLTLAALLGLTLGSFLNVVIARVPEGRSVVRPASACPRCGTEIRPRDNIPVVSWLLLRGKCRDCGLPISAQYPLVELATGAYVTAGVWVGLASGHLVMTTAWLLVGLMGVICWVVIERSRRYREGRRSP